MNKKLVTTQPYRFSERKNVTQRRKGIKNPLEEMRKKRGSSN